MNQFIKKWSIRLGVGGLITLVLLMITLYLSMNFLVEQAIEWEGARATGVAISLDDASVEFNGSGTLNGLRVSNPDNPGFNSKWLMSLDHVKTKVRPGSVFESVVDIPSVHLNGLEVTIERKNDHENYLVVLDRIKKQLESAGKIRKKAGWKFKVQELKITNVKVTFSGFPGMNRTLKLADIHMENVGSQESPLTMTRMTALVFKTVFSQLLTNPEMIPGTVVAGLNEGLRGLGNLGDVTVRFVGNITDDAGNVLGKMGDAAGSTAEKVGGAIKQFFGGGEDESEKETDQ